MESLPSALGIAITYPWDQYLAHKGSFLRILEITTTHPRAHSHTLIDSLPNTERFIVPMVIR